MTIAEARKAARRGIVGGPEVTTGCRHDTVLPRRFGLSTLRFKGKIRVLYVTRTAMPTAKGIRVNDTLDRLQLEVRLQAASSAALGRQPGDTDLRAARQGRRARSSSPSTPRDRIFQIATGLRPEVDFSEGCA